MLRLRSTSRVTTATAIAWGAFATTVGLRAAGVAVSPRVTIGFAAAAAVLALCCAVRTVGAIWRGPLLVSFAHDDAVLCRAPISEFVRRAAQLRGTMGGAGHVHRWRLVIPACAWLGAATLATGASFDPIAPVTGWPLLVLGTAAVATAFLPARPFYYREVNGGGVIVSPRSAPYRLGVPGEMFAVDSGVLRFG